MFMSTTINGLAQPYAGAPTARAKSRSWLKTPVLPCSVLQMSCNIENS
jgi:hypothetical protein